MEYYSIVEGTLIVTHGEEESSKVPLSKEIIEEAERAGLVLPPHRVEDNDLLVETLQSMCPFVDTVDFRRWGAIIDFAGCGAAHYIEQEVRAICTFFEERGASVDGAIYLRGERPLDFSRVVVRNTKAVMEAAEEVTITFPDGSVWSN